MNTKPILTSLALAAGLAIGAAPPARAAEVNVPVVGVNGSNNPYNYGGQLLDIIKGTGMNGRADDYGTSEELSDWPAGQDIPSTWEATSNAYRAEAQMQKLIVGGTNGKVGWLIFDLGANTSGLKNLYLWNIRENSGRICNTYNVYYAVTPTVAAPTAPLGDKNVANDYDFASGGWTLLNGGGALSLPFRGGNPQSADGVVDLQGVSAQYIAIEILTNGGDATRTGLAEIGITREAGSMTWLGGADVWSNAAKWDPALITDGAVTIDVAGSVVTVDAAASGLRVNVGETDTSELIVGAGNTLTWTDDFLGLNVGEFGTLTVNGVLDGPLLSSNGSTSINSASADLTSLGVAQVLGGTFSSTGDLTVGTIEVSGGALSPTGNLAATSLTFDSGSISVGGSQLTADTLTVNGALDLSTETVSVTTALNVNDATLTLGNAVATPAFTLDGGSVSGAVVTADTYSFTNVADYSDDLTGPTSTLVVGEARLTDEKVKISGAGNTYGGGTTIARGTLEVSANAGNLGGGGLTFDSNTYVNNNTGLTSHPAVLQTSGTISPVIGTEVSWTNNGGYAAIGAPLTVSLAPDGGAAGDALSWGNATTGFNGKVLQLGSATATDAVTIPNAITLGGNRRVDVFDNPATSADIAILSGVLGDGGATRTLTVYGDGTLWLTGANDFGVGSLDIRDYAVVRAVDGVGLPTDAKLVFNGNGATLESSGSFSRNISNNAGDVYWNNTGGFAAHGAPLTVNLNGGATIDWSSTNGFRNRTLILGSDTANDVVTLENNVDMKNNRSLYVYDNPDTDSDYAVISGVIANGDANNRRLDLRGGGKLVLTGANTHTGGVTLFDGSTLIVNGDQTAATGLINVQGSCALGGAGTVGGSVDIQGNGGVTFDLSSSTGTHTPLTVLGDIEFKGASTLVVTTGGGASPGIYTLVATSGGVTGGGGVPATVVLPAGWTADAPYIDGNDLKIEITSTGGGGGGPTFDSWSGGLTADGDANGDGVPNAVAYALGAAGPNVDATGLLPTVGYDDSGSPAYLVFTFNRSADAQADASTTIEVEYTTTLGVWTTAVHGVDGVIIDEAGPVVVKIPDTLAPTGDIFARLNVTVTAP